MYTIEKKNIYIYISFMYIIYAIASHDTPS